MENKPLDLLTLQAERYALWAGLEGAGLPALGAVLLQCGLALSREVPLASVNHRGIIRVHPERAAELVPGEIRWVLLHEAIHAGLDHPRRFGRLGEHARERLRAVAGAAAAGHGPAGIAGMDGEEAAAWVRAWTAALADRGQTWADWEARMLRRFAGGLQILGDLLVHAWMEGIARMARPGLLAPPENIYRPDPGEIPALLRASLEELAMRLLEAVIAALPSPEGGEDDDEAGMPPIRTVRELLEAARGGGPLPAPAVPGLAEAAPGKAGEEGPASLPGWAREVLARAHGHGLLPGDMVEALAPGATGIRPLEAELEGFLQQVRRAGEPRPAWRRPARRAIGLEVVLPAREGGRGLLVAVVRDTSGSMDREALERVAAAILATEGMAGILALDADAEVQGGILCAPPGGLELPPEAREALGREIPRLAEGDRAGLARWLTEARGRGGTDFRPALARIRRLRAAGVPLGGILYLTDGEGEFPRPDEVPDLPVRWVVPRPVKVPFGDVMVRPDLFPQKRR